MSTQQPPLVPRGLEGRLAIITGGSRGIGAAIAENLASKGCSLVLNYTSASSTARTNELCESLSSKYSIRCLSVQADLEDAEASVTKIVTFTKENFPKNAVSGEFTIDILINNAGIAEHALLNDPEKGPITPALFHRQNTINVLAPLLLTQAVAPHLPRDRTGRIVNLSSVSANLGFKTQSIYVGTKAALEGMTRTWARELGDRATVNAINPGPVVGDMYFATGEKFWNDMQGWQDNTPLSKIDVEKGFEAGTGEERLDEETRKLVREKMGGRRPAFTDEIAGVVGMLCGKDGGWCTGSVVCANGGLRMGL